MANEKNGLITMHGNPLTLVGPQLAVGDKAPEFQALAQDLSAVKLSQLVGKVCIIAAVPSLDTPVCNVMAKKFSEQAAALGQDVQVVTISMDLPFAQSRWCGGASVDKMLVLSDHRDASFGTAYGMLIKELRLLARSVFVVDRTGKIRHIELVKEQTQEPNYTVALEAARKCLK